MFPGTERLPCLPLYVEPGSGIPPLLCVCEGGATERETDRGKDRKIETERHRLT